MDRQFCGLRTGPQQRNFVDRKCANNPPICSHRFHFQGVDDRLFGKGQPFGERVRAIGVHQKTDRPAIHAIDGNIHILGFVKGLQHKAVPPQSHDNIGAFQGLLAIPIRQNGKRLLCGGCRAGTKGDTAL